MARGWVSFIGLGKWLWAQQLFAQKQRHQDHGDDSNREIYSKAPTPAGFRQVSSDDGADAEGDGGDQAEECPVDSIVREADAVGKNDADADVGSRGANALDASAKEQDIKMRDGRACAYSRSNQDHSNGGENSSMAAEYVSYLGPERQEGG
jgi:hypothetical protein